MPEVLRLDVAADAVRSLTGPTPVLDPTTAAVVEQAVAEAQRRAYAEGEAAGRRAAVDEATSAATRIVTALGGAIDQLMAELAGQREAATTASLQLARVVAAAVVGATPPPEALALSDRIHDAVRLLDDDPLQVRVNPADAAALEGLLSEPRLALVADASVAAGDARVVGQHGGAELTRAALLDAALEVLGGEAT